MSVIVHTAGVAWKAPSLDCVGSALSGSRLPGARLVRQEAKDQSADGFGLLLLHPMAGAVDQMDALHLRAGLVLHRLQRTRVLIDAPIALAADEARRHVDRAAGEQAQAGDQLGLAAAPVALQAALE